MGAAALVLLASTAQAAELPPHGPLRIVIVSDEVNPNNLGDAELTQPGELEAALGDPASGLTVSEVLEVNSQCVDAALGALSDPTAYDVLVYFAHQPARGCDAQDRQAELTGAVSALLGAGGGVVVFHHGIYEAPGKEAILQLLGGTAGAIEWSVGDGQNIIDVAPHHFVTTNSVEYAFITQYGDSQVGVADGPYDSFNNTPDERYPALSLLKEPGETRVILFGSDYANNGSKHVLGYDLKRPGWQGRVVFYQPGEYQPHALDDKNGNNFQILANAIVHASQGTPECVCRPGIALGCHHSYYLICADHCLSAEPVPCSRGSECFDGSCVGGGPGETGGTTTLPWTTGDPGGTLTSSGPSTDGGPTTGSDPSTTSGVGPTGGSTAVSDAGESEGSRPGESGCGCRGATEPRSLAWIALMTLVMRRRRRA